MPQDILRPAQKVQPRAFGLIAETGSFGLAGAVVKFPPPLVEIFNTGRRASVFPPTPPACRPETRAELRASCGPHMWRASGDGVCQPKFWYVVKVDWPHGLVEKRAFNTAREAERYCEAMARRLDDCFRSSK